jgi:hypothetical protein
MSLLSHSQRTRSVAALARQRGLALSRELRRAHARIPEVLPP